MTKVNALHNSDGCGDDTMNIAMIRVVAVISNWWQMMPWIDYLFIFCFLIVKVCCMLYDEWIFLLFILSYFILFCIGDRRGSDKSWTQWCQYSHKVGGSRTEISVPQRWSCSQLHASKIWSGSHRDSNNAHWRAHHQTDQWLCQPDGWLPEIEVGHTNEIQIHRRSNI